MIQHIWCAQMQLNYHQIRGGKQINLSTCTQKHMSKTSELFWSSKCFIGHIIQGEAKADFQWVNKTQCLFDTEVWNDGRGGCGKRRRKWSSLEFSVCKVILLWKIEERSHTSSSGNKMTEKVTLLFRVLQWNVYTHTYICMPTHTNSNVWFFILYWLTYYLNYKF